jgi:hypothetical protein
VRKILRPNGWANENCRWPISHPGRRPYLLGCVRGSEPLQSSTYCDTTVQDNTVSTTILLYNTVQCIDYYVLLHSQSCVAMRSRPSIIDALLSLGPSLTTEPPLQRVADAQEDKDKDGRVVCLRPSQLMLIGDRFFFYRIDI